ncbi:MAG: DMT family transporter [Pseudomonadota bacterium]
MDLRALAAGVAFAFMWSSAFTSARLVVADAPPFAALSVRFALSGLVAIAIATLIGQSARISPAQWRAVVLFGICQNTLYLGLNFAAMRWVEASVAVIVASLLPLVVALASRFVFAERLPPLGIAGLAIGLVGVIVIMQGRLAGGGVDAAGLALMIAGLLSLAGATLLLREALPKHDLLMMVGLQMLVGSATLLPLALIFDSWQVTWTLSLGLAFAYTTIFPGLVATLTWFWLVRRIGPTRSASFHFLNPFLGVAVAALVLAEPLTLRDALGVAVVMLGILAVQRARRSEAGAAAKPPLSGRTG